mmetsp:Transcript_22207/g.30544  ORF Transcript_22207/g.30544 Transcript_22207/m.30544 type:complete len:247 (-) Transcript_22207:154-894(-)|eukprot:CAMPEP_0201480888 /NCGR_PEP_ID=MMETSP0151_2-20130828/5270_1 /ASSEMBLY_ACC=CAM_ASM_000257 /TAXON_ID=200890 /ORGANISM="Paramoeba atlantica, Strain 621/1 / CCAP 1560/9" /LENGTH=246 /DNA_ID=CAMNT_0047862875 /DNA_START=20 /DNA_END=760 /DNA_ORIENTATION=-
MRQSLYACMDECASAKTDEKFSVRRQQSAKVRGAIIPAEYAMEKFLQTIQHTQPAWSTNTPICEWPGILCDTKLQVESIKWTSQDLSGTVRCSMVPSTVEKLNLSNNLLTGSLHLADLPYCLQQFHAHHNDFEGNLELADLPPHMERLMLSSNRFSGSIDLRHLPNLLQSLWIDRNLLTGSLELDALPSQLRILKLSDNLFSGCVKFPEVLPSCLIEININRNALHIPSSLPCGVVGWDQDTSRIQ